MILADQLRQLDPLGTWSPWYEVAPAAQEDVEKAFLSGETITVEGWFPPHAAVTDLNLESSRDDAVTMTARFERTTHPIHASQ